MFLKISTTAISVLGSRATPLRIAAATGLILAQIGEFSFVLERAGRAAGLTPGDLGEAGAQTFIAATVLLMMATPFKMQGCPLVRESIMGHLSLPPRGNRHRPTRRTNGRRSYGRPRNHRGVRSGGAKRLVQVLQDRGIPFVVVEMNPVTLEPNCNPNNIPVIFGDASRPHIFCTPPASIRPSCWCW